MPFSNSIKGASGVINAITQGARDARDAVFGLFFGRVCTHRPAETAGVQPQATRNMTEPATAEGAGLDARRANISMDGLRGGWRPNPGDDSDSESSAGTEGPGSDAGRGSIGSDDLAGIRAPVDFLGMTNEQYWAFENQAIQAGPYSEPSGVIGYENVADAAANEAAPLAEVVNERVEGVRWISNNPPALKVFASDLIEDIKDLLGEIAKLPPTDYDLTVMEKIYNGLDSALVAQQGYAQFLHNSGVPLDLANLCANVEYAHYILDQMDSMGISLSCNSHSESDFQEMINTCTGYLRDAALCLGDVELNIEQIASAPAEQQQLIVAQLDPRITREITRAADMHGVNLGALLTDIRGQLDENKRDYVPDVAAKFRVECRYPMVLDNPVVFDQGDVNILLEHILLEHNDRIIMESAAFVANPEAGRDRFASDDSD